MNSSSLSFVQITLVVFFFSIYRFSHSTSDFDLQHVHFLFRHGDRTPILQFPTDGQKAEEVWPQGFGQLTDKGIEQQFLLGKWLRMRYENFVPLEYNASYYYMRSTDIDRTLMSAAANMAGFFQGAPSPLDKYGLAWSPVPIHTVAQKNDILLLQKNCPRLSELYKELEHSEKAHKVEEAHKDMFKLLSLKSGLDYVNISNFWLIQDDITCMRAHNLALPSWLTESLLKEIKQVNTELIQIVRLTNSEVLRLQIGVFLHSFMKHIHDLIIHGDASKIVLLHQKDNGLGPIDLNKNMKDGKVTAHKMMAYSAHDTDVAPLLAALGIHLEANPAYASIALLELVGPPPPGSLDDYSLRLFFKNGPEDITGQPLQFSACEDQPSNLGCPVKIVFKGIQNLLLKPEDVDKACNTYAHNDLASQSLPERSDIVASGHYFLSGFSVRFIIYFMSAIGVLIIMGLLVGIIIYMHPGYQYAPVRLLSSSDIRDPRFSGLISQ